MMKTAERRLFEQCGTNMSVWFVGNAPVAHYQPSSKPHLFFMKSQIFSGQVTVPTASDAKGGKLEAKEEFAWVTKSELESYLEPSYFEAVKDALAE